MTLSGFDIANVNGPNAITAALAGDFVILKATEGLTFVDQFHDQWAAQVRAAGKPLGHYHFAHVANDPAGEARFFVAAAKAAPGEVLVLDFEPYGQSAPDSAYPGWVVAFAGEVARLTGVKPWIYLNDDMGGRTIAQATPAQAAAIRSLPLWKARYATDPGPLMGWPSLTCWQFSATGADQDTFYGDAATWRALGVPQPPAPTSEEDDMKLYLVRHQNGAVFLATPRGALPLNGDQFAALQAGGVELRYNNLTELAYSTIVKALGGYVP